MSQSEEVLNEAMDTCRQLLEQQNWQQASEICVKINEVVPDHPQVILFAGVADMGLGRPDDAECQFQKLVQLMPDLAVAHQQLAQVAIWRGDISAAIEHLANAAEHADGDADLYCRLAEYHLFTGAVEHGLAALDKARSIAPGHNYPAVVAQAFEAAKQAREMPVENGVVAIISDDPRIREAKLAAACSHQGWRPVLFCRNLPGYDAREYFADVVQYQSPWEAVVKASALRPHTYHCVAQMKYETNCAFLATQPGPIICDLYDNVDQLSDAFFDLEPVRRMDRALERSVITRTEGLVCRGLETQYVKRDLGIDLPCNRLFFPEYAWGDLECLPKLSSNDGELHLFFGGSFWNEKRFPDYADCGGLLWFAELTSEMGVHFHLYPGAGSDEEFEDLYSDYRALDDRSQYFHLNRPIREIRAFLREASQYDAGVMFLKAFLEGREMRQYAPTKMKYAYGNRVADYIDTSLHYIAPIGTFQHRMARHLGNAIDITPEVTTQQYWDRVKRQVLDTPADFERIRQRFSIEFQAPRLIQFYESFR